ncbi:hypothetical protein M9H77_13220 [Catharanthus roseus]|uniref:Uncharacterized protein n=1 Tax=Catharanthus roseus TaxID=4058 RepID=A0ACC0BJK7_CATRO|nr:hypothetical protein M9H77_13220 [Catharanthus roseus]
MRKVQTIILGAWFLLVVHWIAPPLSMIFSRHMQCNYRVVVPGNLYWSVVLVELRGALVTFPVAGPVKDTLMSLHILADKDMQIPDMEEKEMEDQKDGDLEIQGLTFRVTLLGLTPPAQSHPSRSGTSYIPPPITRGTSYVPPPLDPLVGCSFGAPPPSSTAGSAIPLMPISYAFSSDSDKHDDERTDNVTPPWKLGFGHRIVTDIQLGMRFVDKIQAISAVQKWSIRMRREFRVVKKISVSNVIKEVQVLLQTGCTYKRACYGKWREYTLPCSHALAVCRENGTRPDAYMPDIYSQKTYKRTY